MPIFSLKDSRAKISMALVVPSKGVAELSASAAKKMVEQLGYKNVMLRSETAILGLQNAVRKESGFEVILEKVLAGDHQVKAVARDSIKNAQGQIRAIKDAL